MAAGLNFADFSRVKMRLLGEKNYGSGILEVCTEQISDQKNCISRVYMPFLKASLKGYYCTFLRHCSFVMEKKSEECLKTP